MRTKMKYLCAVLLVCAMIAGYLFVVIVPYLDTFGNGYAFQNHFYANFYASYFISGEPDRCLTLDGRLLKNSVVQGKAQQEIITRVFGRIPLFKFNFDNLFSGAAWTHYGVDAQWLRQNTKAAWIGFKLEDGVLFMDYILKLDDGNLVACRGSLLSATGGFHPHLGYAEYYEPAGTVQDFYQYIEDINCRN